MISLAPTPKHYVWMALQSCTQGVTRTPLWSAEHLTRARLNQAKTIDREDSFHEESRLRVCSSVIGGLFRLRL